VKRIGCRFQGQREILPSPGHQEQEARRDFIDKFWLALGWDVNQRDPKEPLSAGVKVERKEHGFSQRRADYAFYLAPNFPRREILRRAKKPHGDSPRRTIFQTPATAGQFHDRAVLHDF